MMFAFRWFAFLILLALTSAATAADRDGITLLHFEPVERLAIRNEGHGGMQKPGDTGPIHLSFDAFGRRFDLELEPNASLLAAIPNAMRGEAGVPYRGRIAGIPDSWARIVVADGALSGLIWDGKGMIGIEPPGNNLAGSSRTITFRLSDVIIEPGALSCASGNSSPKTAATVLQAIVGGVADAMAPGAFEEINIGVVADTEATDIHGAGTQAEILTRINNVDGIYSQQIGVQITPQIEVFTDANDPFLTPADAGTGETNVSALLTELRSYRTGSSAQRALGLTHLYTGRDLEGTTAGIAYLGVVCLQDGGVGLSEISTRPVIDALVAAHEIGHNFGAEHDGDPAGSCPSAPLNHIMAPSVNPANNTFSDCSVGVMQASAAAAQCITTLLNHDVSITLSTSNSTVLLTNAFQVSADVVNLGTDDVTGVVVDLALPANVSFTDATGATCTESAGTVSCPLGTIAAGGMATIVVSSDAVAVGSDVIAASVSADTDERPNNNQDSLQLTVDPAVDLVVTEPPSAQVILNQSTTVTATLENQSSIDATGVNLVIALDAGLQADSATWSIGTCNVAAQLIDCQANQFDSQSSSTVQIGVTGTATGNKHYTVAMDSNEADSNPADNSVEGTVRVNSENNNNDDEGGGSFGWLFLLLLAALSLRAQRSNPTWSSRA